MHGCGSAVLLVLLLQEGLLGAQKALTGSGAASTLGITTVYASPTVAAQLIPTTTPLNLVFEKAGAFSEVDQFIQKARQEADKINALMAAALKRRRGKYDGPFRYRYREYSRPMHYPPWYYDQAVSVEIPSSLEMKEPRGFHE